MDRMNLTWRITPATMAGFLLTILYTGFYLGNPATPGNQSDPCCITGWIVWIDQGLYYKSAAALAAGNLDPALHWYPLGYAVLAAPFTFLGSHPFFFVDLIALIAAYTAFILFARRVAVPPGMAAVLFLLTSCADTAVFEQWAIPWTSTPAAAVIWGLLAISAGHLQGDRRPFLLGVLAGSLPLLRPTDAIVCVICLAWCAVADLRSGRLRWRDVLLVAAGIAMPVLPYLALHLAIYGPQPSQYMLGSRVVGFTVHNLVWRAYVLLIEPRQWFFSGQGLMQHRQWLLFGFAGAFWALRRGDAVALLAACLIAYGGLYLCYVDLLPTSLWTYKAIHYFKWTFPGLGLLAWLLLGALFRRQRLAWTALAVVFLLSCIRVTPRPADSHELANMVDIPGPAATDGDTMMEPRLFVVDDLGIVQNVTVMRAFPFPSGDGVRLIGLRRDFLGTIKRGFSVGPDIAASTGPQRRWAEQIGFGYPCWLFLRACKKSAAWP
jgi:hypothetical protein